MPFDAMMCKNKETAMNFHKAVLLDFLSRGLTIDSCYIGKCVGVVGCEWEYAVLGVEPETKTEIVVTCPTCGGPIAESQP